MKILNIFLKIQVTAIRQKKRATVDSIKGQFGFLDYEVEEGKKLFFHMSEVQGNSYNLYPGDTVEFSIVTNQVEYSFFNDWIFFY
jgi:cold shock CspA family protein